MEKVKSIYIADKNIPTKMTVVQGATAPAIVFTLEDYTPASGATARIFIQKANSEVYNECTLSGNTVTFSPTTGSFDEEGPCVAQLEIVSGGKIALSYRIWVYVEPNIINGEAIEASDDFSALQQAIVDVGNITEYKAQTDTNTADIAAMKPITDKFSIASSLNTVRLGDGANTDQLWMWGNGTNKIGLGAYNNIDEGRWNVLVRTTGIILQSQISGTSSSVYTISPDVYQAGESITIPANATWVGHITNNSKALDFFIPLRRSPVGRTCTLSLNSSNGLSARTGTGGYVNGSQYIDTTDLTITVTPNYFGLYVRVASSAAYTGIGGNNQACSVQIAGTISFS